MSKRVGDRNLVAVTRTVKRKMRRAAEHAVPVRWHIVNDESPCWMPKWTALRGGWLWLAFLEVGGKKAAGAFNFDYGDRLWGYNSGVNRDFIELSPGWVLLSHTLQWACEHGRAEFDFMRGNEEYKYRFGARDRRVMRAKVAR